MRARDVIGRRITEVYQQRTVSLIGPAVELIYLRLDDGSRIVFHASDREDGSYVHATVIKPPKEPKP